VNRPRFLSILVSITELCPVGCSHCGLIGSARERTADVAALTNWMRQVCDYGIPIVIFTGGEPFYQFSLLETGVRTTRECSTPAGVFTSSFWASSIDEAARLLRRLKGLRHLFLSTDVYHQKRVPYKNVHNAIRAADLCGIPEITLCITYSKEAELESVRSHYKSLGNRVGYYTERLIPSPYLPSAINEQDSYKRPHPADYGSSCSIGAPIISPNGDVFSCHVGKASAHGNLEDSPYWLGNLSSESFASILEKSASRPEYQYLRTHGPSGVARLFVEYPTLVKAIMRDRFTGPCDMCFSTLSIKEGYQALNEFTRCTQIIREIDIRLALTRGESPLPSKREYQ
jgi:hypothetical protein